MHFIFLINFQTVDRPGILGECEGKLRWSTCAKSNGYRGKFIVVSLRLRYWLWVYLWDWHYKPVIKKLIPADLESFRRLKCIGYGRPEGIWTAMVPGRNISQSWGYFYATYVSGVDTSMTGENYVLKNYKCINVSFIRCDVIIEIIIIIS